jgi:hypothetical protein
MRMQNAQKKGKHRLSIHRNSRYYFEEEEIEHFLYSKQFELGVDQFMN